MGKRFLSSFSIMNLDTSHLEEICQDIKEQYDNGIADCALFSMTLVPEGNPPADKVSILCEKFAKFRDRLEKLGVECGILVQASVGHGWILGDMFPYQTHVNFCDGKATRVCCPCDSGFKEYIYNVMKTLASYNPACIMLDDDFRLIWYKGEGCACPLHMERFNSLLGTSLTRKELWEIVNSSGELSKKYTDAFIEVQRESLLETARVIREAIDSVNPSLPMSYCCCGNNAEFASEIATILAGEGNLRVVRINNGNYTPLGAKGFSRVFQRIATQREKLEGRVDRILCETDTCPQNRYSTSASSLHTHYTGSILEGANGAKHWITRLISYEPESGRAYRKILSKNLGFYEKLAELYKRTQWKGFRIFTPSKPNFTYGRVKEECDGWSFSVLEKMGLPMYFSSKSGGIVCLEGEIDSYMSDEEVLELLKGSAFIASDTARRLIDRGFKKYLGVDIRPWQGKTPVREIFKNGSLTKVQEKALELVPLNDEVIIESVVCNTSDYESYEELFPAVTSYKNELGGQICVFCGTPVAEFDISHAFSFLNYSRKEQLISLAKKCGELLVYYPNDEDIYLKVGEIDDGRTLCALFNLCLDPIENIELVLDFEASSFEKLMPDGSTSLVDFYKQGDKYTLSCPLNTLDPVVIFITKKIL